jgi:hypothetical protein
MLLTTVYGDTGSMPVKDSPAQVDSGSESARTSQANLLMFFRSTDQVYKFTHPAR